MRGLPILLSVLLAAGPALALKPPSAANTVAPVTVPAPKSLSKKELDEVVTKFVGAVSAPSRIGHVSRWMTRLCPRALGLPEGFGPFVERRILQVADQVGVPHKGDCRQANVFVLVTPEPQALIDGVRKTRPILLGYHFAAQTKALATFKGPIDAWYVTATVAGDLAYRDSEFEQAPGGVAGSRLGDGLSSSFEDVLIILDAAQIDGQPIGKIADVAAMMALARSQRFVSDRGCHDLPTILDALNPACPPGAGIDGLTPADLVYLKALYAADDKWLPVIQKGQIAGLMDKSLGQAAAPRAPAARPPGP